MLTISIRHKFEQFEKERPKIQKELIPKLYDKNQICIHFQDPRKKEKLDKKDALNEQKYTTRDGKKAINIFKDIKENGAIALASYTFKKKIHFKIGEIKPQNIQLIPDPDLGEEYWVKILDFSTVTKSVDKPIRYLLQPPRNKTIIDLSNSSKEKIIMAIFKGENLPETIDSLIPSQQEVLCYEYLRKEGKISHLLLPIGRTLPMIDIYGIDGEGNEVIAQVTHSENDKEIKKKSEALNETKAHKKYLFTKKEKYDFSEIEHFNLTEIFKYHMENPMGKKMIKKMLSYAESDRQTLQNKDLLPKELLKEDSGRIARL